MAEEKSTSELTQEVEELKKVSKNLAELLTNSVNMVDKYYEIFFDQTPHYVELEQYDKSGILRTVSVPNRAMDKSVALSGNDDPEGIVDAVIGALYVNNITRELFMKKTARGNIGWVNITPQPIEIYKESFNVNSETQRVQLIYKAYSKAYIDVFLNGIHLEQADFDLDTDQQTLVFHKQLSNNSTLQVSYLTGLYGLKGDKGETGSAGTVKVGKITTGKPGTNAIVANTGDKYNAVLDFTIPRGDKGETGDSATIKVGKVATGKPGTNVTIKNTGDKHNAVFDFTIPRGDKGETGSAATIKVGKLTTGNPGTNVTITNTGNENNAVFDFTIPRGDKGETGDSGVYCGSEEPKNEEVKVWIDISGEANLLGGLCLPATDSYKDVVLTDGTVFEADNHGYLVFAKVATQAGQYIQIDGGHPDLTVKSMIFTGNVAPVANSTVYCPPVPMAKGQQVKITCTANGNTVASRFIYTMSDITHAEPIDLDPPAPQQ